jgi:lysophospholipase L1-like esterase
MMDLAGLTATTPYEDDILAIQNRLAIRPLPTKPIAFFGSSSFRLWRSMNADLGSLDVVNLGFGGGTNASAAFYFERVFAPLNPSKIVLYFGENDISNDGLTGEIAFRDFCRLQELIAAKFPAARVFVLSAKQSPTKWLYEDVVRSYNALVAEWCERDRRYMFVDVTSPLLGINGRPIGRYYEPDLIHLNMAGYAVWTDLLRRLPGLFA